MKCCNCLYSKEIEIVKEKLLCEVYEGYEKIVNPNDYCDQYEPCEDDTIKE